MKILNLKILNNKNEELRSIDFNENGISYILGNVEKPKNKTKTSNSIGKTLLLKFIDYIYGSNEFSDKTLLNNLDHFRIKAKVKYNNKYYNVMRIVNEKNIFINNESYKLSDFRIFFNIERSLYEKQIILQTRQNIISILPHATEKDYKSVLTLLNLTEICKSVVEIYKIQEQITSNKSKCSDYISVLKLNEKEVESSLFINSKNIEKLNNKIDSIKEEIKQLKLTKENLNLQSEYCELNNKLKLLKYHCDSLENEKDSLIKYIDDTENSTLTSTDVEKLYKIAKIEIPDLVKRQLKDVDEFYKQIYVEHIEKSKFRISEIDNDLKNMNLEISSLVTRLDELSNILSTNDIYNNALEILNSYNLKLQEETFKKGQLEQLSLLKKEQISLNQKISNLKQKLTEQYEKANELINKYKNFVYDVINEIYEKTINAIFYIEINDNKYNKSPINIDMTISGDLGEGITEVKKNVMDYLLFKFNNLINILMQDSCCYNGIDPRQVTSLLNHLDKIAMESNKQAIISINKYQIDDLFVKEIINKAKITLSEDDKLLKFDF